MTVKEIRRPDDEGTDREWLMMDLLFIDDCIYQTARGALNAAVAEINKKFGSKLFEVDEGGIMGYICNLRGTDGKFVREQDRFMADMFGNICSVLPGNITVNNHSLMRIDRV